MGTPFDQSSPCVSECVVLTGDWCSVVATTWVFQVLHMVDQALWCDMVDQAPWCDIVNITKGQPPGAMVITQCLKGEQRYFDQGMVIGQKWLTTRVRKGAV
uniref:Uncharacterized protein n=1 Tax=Eutreptiella gymnastica TaxID=73025 RepID=A0A7S4G4U1_9EUGL|mmetsp:Transcript_59652/g.98352  ORF Transcript_59652/g.98352 Transcript_59652/m.98352 type:complete len:101 (+) Transcript_59652:254-556(+)